MYTHIHNKLIHSMGIPHTIQGGWAPRTCYLLSCSLRHPPPNNKRSLLKKKKSLIESI